MITFFSLGECTHPYTIFRGCKQIIWNSIVGETEYLGRCAKRTRSVVQFSRSDVFYESLLIGPPSSIPRWRYARTLEEKDKSHSRSRSADASAALVDSTRQIIKGGNYTVQHFVDRGGEIRI